MKYVPRKGIGVEVNGPDIPETDGAFKGIIDHGASRGGLSMSDMKRGHTPSQRISGKSDPVEPA